MNNEVEEVSAAETEVGAEAQKIKDFLENVLRGMNVGEFTVQVSENPEAVCLEISGKETNAVIGHHGEVLDALQYLCSLLLSNRNGDNRRVVLDAEGYRERRKKALQRLAGNLEAKVRRTGRPAKLEPMNPYERRIIHTALQNSKFVTTESEGQGAARHVVVSPKEQNNVLNTPEQKKTLSLNFVFRSDKKRR